jgi:hypothetical protein
MESEQSAPQGVFVVRLVLGLAQGLALYLLYSAFDQKAWPATVPMLFAPLTVVALFIPLVVSQALGNLRTTTLLIWSGTAALIVAGLAWYDVWHAWPGAPAGVVPSARAFLVCGVFLFVAHALVSCGDADRRIVAHYPTLFDLAWKLGVQVAIIICFTGAFWIMLWLGIALFDMIKLTGFSTFITHPWVAIPLTTIAAAAAIHVTDTRANLVRGVRTLALTLLGWLLPVIALIAFAFLISLVFTGLQPLWETRSATFLLMAAAVVLIIHINAAYQDGDTRPPHILRVAGTLAAVLLIFIVWIAGYALWLRVGQYGWTVDRITSAAGVLIAGVFAVGYLIAALLPGLWLKLIERWNVYGTFVFLIVLFALTTPIADPMRLSVIDQVHRLNSGVVKADKFDFGFLRFHGGHFGHVALVELRSSADPIRRDRANSALNGIVFMPPPARAVDRPVAKAIAMHPVGTKLPESFVRQNWADVDENSGNVGVCILQDRSKEISCDAIAADLDGDGQQEIVVVLTSFSWWTADVYKEKSGMWRHIASINPCGADRSALLAGKFVTQPSRLPDVVVDGTRVQVVPQIERCAPPISLAR